MNISSSSISVSWAEPDPTNGIITSYTLQYYNSSDGGLIATFEEISTLSRTVTGLTPFTTYLLEVVALTDRGAGPPSDAVTVYTLEDGEASLSVLQLSLCCLVFPQLRVLHLRMLLGCLWTPPVLLLVGAPHL